MELDEPIAPHGRRGLADDADGFDAAEPDGTAKERRAASVDWTVRCCRRGGPVLYLLAAALAGCGSSGSAPSAPTPDPTPPIGTSPSVTATPVATREPEADGPVFWAAGSCTPLSPDSCRGGVVARSADLGRTWTTTFLNSEIDVIEGSILAVAFATRDKGWVAGAQGALFRTIDGGATWTRQVTGIELPEKATARGVVELDSIAFSDERRGIIVGIGRTDEVIGVFGPSLIYRNERFVLLTEDGGETWRPAEIDGDRATGSVNSACFTGAGIGLITGNGPTLLSRNGGRTWKAIDDRLPYTGWRHAECQGEATLWLGTVDFARSDDGGDTWAHLTPGGLGFTCCGGAADFVTADVGWSFTEQLLNTVDGGRTWEAVETPPRPGAFTTIEFASPDVGVWAGNGGAWVTHDGGESWFFSVIVPLELQVRIWDVVVVE